MKKGIALEIICFLFILLFSYAAVSKLMDVEKFTIQIGQSPLLTDFSKVLAWMVPSIELLIAGMIVVNRLRRIALYASFTLMLIFTAYIVAILNFSEKVPCSCGGVLSEMGWTEHLIFNAGFVLLGLIGIILQSHKVESNRQVLVSKG